MKFTSQLCTVALIVRSTVKEKLTAACSRPLMWDAVSNTQFFVRSLCTRSCREDDSLAQLQK